MTIWCSIPPATAPAPRSCSCRPTGLKVKATERYFLDGNVLQNHHGGFVLIDGVLYGGHG
jgi:hypothetical protein